MHQFILLYFALEKDDNFPFFRHIQDGFENRNVRFQRRIIDKIVYFKSVSCFLVISTRLIRGLINTMTSSHRVRQFDLYTYR